MVSKHFPRLYQPLLTSDTADNLSPQVPSNTADNLSMGQEEADRGVAHDPRLQSGNCLRSPIAPLSRVLTRDPTGIAGLFSEERTVLPIDERGWRR